MNAEKLNPFVRYIHYIEPQYMYRPYHRIGYDHRLFFCESGKIQIDVGNEVYTLVKNSILFVPSGETYVLGTHKDSAKMIGINFDFGYNFSHISIPIPPVTPGAGYDFAKQLEKPDFTDLKCFEAPFILHGQSELGAIIYHIFDEYNTSKIYHAQNESAMLKQLLILLARVLTLGADKAPQKTVNIVIAYIQEHYMENISNADIGNALNFHPNYLNRIMIKHTGRSLHRYLLYYRLTKALDRLQSTDCSISEIAEKSGFSDLGHFTKAFKKQFGNSPKAMRERII